VLKIADLRRGFPSKWQSVAEVTCMRRGWFAPNQRIGKLWSPVSDSLPALGIFFLWGQGWGVGAYIFYFITAILQHVWCKITTPKSISTSL
jgi:polyferredoxin